MLTELSCQSLADVAKGNRLDLQMVSKPAVLFLCNSAFVLDYQLQDVSSPLLSFLHLITHYLCLD